LGKVLVRFKVQELDFDVQHLELEARGVQLCKSGGTERKNNTGLEPSFLEIISFELSSRLLGKQRSGGMQTSEEVERNRASRRPASVLYCLH
jgi:hypothetical protein